MDCPETTRLLGALLDSELDPETAETVAEHLAHCPQCQTEFERQSKWRRAIRQAAPRYRATGALRNRIVTAIASEAEETAALGQDGASRGGGAAEVQPLRGRAEQWRPSWGPSWRPWAMAAALLLSISASSGLTAYVMQNSGDPLVDEIVESHIRSLMAEHLTDVASTDQHTVKPWFHGRIDLAPPVEDLAAEGFPLIGGRLDYIDGHPVAALVYRHRQHPINLFVLPAEAQPRLTPDALSKRGYTVLHWNQDALSFWAVSDLNPTELKEFEALFEKRSAIPPADMSPAGTPR